MAFVSAFYRDFCMVTIIVVSFRFVQLNTLSSRNKLLLRIEREARDEKRLIFIAGVSLFAFPVMFDFLSSALSGFATLVSMT
jgi:hypothetical protein